MTSEIGIFNFQFRYIFIISIIVQKYINVIVQFLNEKSVVVKLADDFQKYFWDVLIFSKLHIVLSSDDYMQQN